MTVEILTVRHGIRKLEASIMAGEHSLQQCLEFFQTKNPDWFFALLCDGNTIFFARSKWRILWRNYQIARAMKKKEKK